MDFDQEEDTAVDNGLFVLALVLSTIVCVLWLAQCNDVHHPDDARMEDR